MLVSSCNDTGTNTGVDRFVRIIKEITVEHHLSPFTLAAIRHTLTKADLVRILRQGERIPGLDGREDLTLDTFERTANVVPVMGAEPFVEALRRGADVIIAARANAFNFSIRRLRPAGGPGEKDVFGCQQYGPLFDLEIPL